MDLKKQAERFFISCISISFAMLAIASAFPEAKITDILRSVKT